MDTTCAQKLSALTNRFYEEAAASFSATREHPWPGWARVAAAVEEHAMADRPDQPLAILDLGCGNMRFERFLGDALPDVPVQACAIDDCPALAEASESTLPGNVQLTFQRMDIAQALARSTLDVELPRGPYDLAVSFGFMHHLPLPAWRAVALQAMVDRTRPGGLIAASFWQFLDDARLREKAGAATARGCPTCGIAFDDPHDRLLGWQDRDDIFRYCHHFAEDEIDRIVGSLSGVREIDRFSADGHSELNRYVLLQRRR